MDLREWLTKNDVKMAPFGARIKTAQSIVSRIANRKHYPSPMTARRIVAATRGEVTLADLYDLPPKHRCKHCGS